MEVTEGYDDFVIASRNRKIDRLLDHYSEIISGVKKDVCLHGK